MSRIRLTDVPQFLSWLFINREKNCLDLDVLDYPTLSVYSTENVGFLPTHMGGILESLALNPDAEPKDKLEAVVAMVNEASADASRVGIRELFYISSDERTDQAAMKHLGFEKVIAYRKKLK